MYTFKDMKVEKGVTLIELSIVIIIIGLIIAGVIGGNALVHQTKIRKVISEVNALKVASDVFKLKYHGIPGDINTGDNYWPGCENSTPCSGNGDGVYNHTESYIAWRQLSLAGLIKGEYAGYTGQHVRGVNATGSDILESESGFGRYYLNTEMVLGRVGKNSIILGSRFFSNEFRSQGVTVREAFDIDTKIDDGHASKGSVLSPTGMFHAGHLCSHTFRFPTTNSYNMAYLNHDTFLCVMAFYK